MMDEGSPSVTRRSGETKACLGVALSVCRLRTRQSSAKPLSLLWPRPSMYWEYAMPKGTQSDQVVPSIQNGYTGRPIASASLSSPRT